MDINKYKLGMKLGDVSSLKKDDQIIIPEYNKWSAKIKEYRLSTIKNITKKKTYINLENASRIKSNTEFYIYEGKNKKLYDEYFGNKIANMMLYDIHWENISLAIKDEIILLIEKRRLERGE